MYGYQEQELIGKSINLLVPALSPKDDINHLKFFGGRSSKDVTFPAILSFNRHVAVEQEDLASLVVKITALPSIAGSISFHRQSGLVQHVNTVPAKYLFGRSVDTILTMNIQDLIPQISLVFSNPRHSTAYVCHRDKSRFMVNIEIRLAKDDLVHLWITYDRALSNLTPQVPKNPPVKARVCSFGSAEKSKRIFPQKNHELPPRFARINSFSSVDRRFENFDTEGGKAHPLDDYVILGLLGQGTYGMAKLAYKKDDPSKKKYVIKYIIKSKIIVDSWIRDRQLGSVPIEIHILHTLQKHPDDNCCQLLKSMEDEDCYFVVMDLLGEGMDLFKYIESNKKMIREEEIKKIFYQISSAIRHLHANRIVHRDIKDENVILDDKGNIQLIDFGCAAYYKQGRTFDTFTGTIEYCAPELLRGKLYEGPPQDIWASGVLLFTLTYKKNPFNTIDAILENELEFPPLVSEELIDLMKKMLNRNVPERLTIDQVMAHPWFKLPNL